MKTVKIDLAIIDAIIQKCVLHCCPDSAWLDYFFSFIFAVVPGIAITKRTFKLRSNANFTATNHRWICQPIDWSSSHDDMTNTSFEAHTRGSNIFHIHSFLVGHETEHREDHKPSKYTGTTVDDRNQKRISETRQWLVEM